METKLFFRHAIKNAAYVFVFVWTIFTANAQCPKIGNPAPPAICDASGFTFNDLSTFATDGGDGIVWYNTLTGGTPFSPFQLVQEGTYYADNNSGNCVSRPFIVIDFTVNKTGQNLDGVYCSNENPTVQTYITDVLQPNIPSGGSVLVYNDVNLTSLANTSDPIPTGANYYYMVFTDGPAGTGCRGQQERARTAVFVSPTDPTPLSPQPFCSNSNPTIASLDPGTTSPVNWYNNIDGFGNPILPALSPSTPLMNGNTYYVQINDGFCESNAVPVVVTINDPFDPGTSGNLEYCSDSVPTSDFDLFGELGGSPDNNGVWSGPIATSNGYQGTVNISTLTTAGVYAFTYTVPSNGACPESSSNVVITIYPTYTAGTVSTQSPVSFCVSGLPSAFDLTSLLDNEDLGGLWTQGTLSTDPAVTSPIDLTSFIPGTYNFTYTQNVSPNPCPEDSKTVQVIVLQNPNAGTAINPSPQFCENDLAANSPLNLFNALDGSQDNGGTWTDAANATISNPIDITGYTVAGSPYTFNYTVDNGTCTDTEIISITIAPAPESGTAVPQFPEFCVSDITTGQTVNLFDLLDGTQDTNGTWYEGTDTSGTGTIVPNSVDISSFAESTYDFTYSVPDIGSCSDADVTVSIIINDTLAPNASPTQEFCDSATVGDLVTTTGTSIQWYDDAAGGSPLAGSVSLVDGGTYYATQTDATSGCESSVRFEVTATIYQSPNVGNANTTAIVACNNTTINLFNGLDGTEDAAGTWYEGPDNTGTTVASPTAYDVTGFIAGTYQFTYYVTASAPCTDANIVITVTIEEPLSAGTSDGDLTFCSNDASIDLFDNLTGEDVGGQWLFNANPVSNIFDPSTSASGTYTYSIGNACGTASTSFDVNVLLAPNAGTDNTVLICVIDGLTDLTAFLSTDAQSGGTWTYASGSVTEQFDPNVDPAGDYVYTVTGTSPCAPSASAVITVTVDDSSAPTVVTATPEFCLEDNPTVADLDASISVTGTIKWYTDATLATALAPTDTLIDGEDYFATQTNSSGCESSQNIQVNVTVNDAPTPTLADPNQELCINDGPTILDLTLNISEYDSNTDNVIWYDVATGGSPLASSTLLIYAVTYYAVLYDSVTGCESSVRLAVTPDVTACGELILPDGFSPNGDGINDTYDYNNLDILFPNFEIQIFNRYGTVLYKGRASTPRFDGTSNQPGAILKGKLPVGVYFYIFRYNDGINKPEQGRLYLSR
tara:strand:- start:1514 stop:5197 length:3684 start_codon:yes stop_codon:yes gene_type:complete